MGIMYMMERIYACMGKTTNCMHALPLLPMASLHTSWIAVTHLILCATSCSHKPLWITLISVSHQMLRECNLAATQATVLNLSA